MLFGRCCRGDWSPDCQRWVFTWALIVVSIKGCFPNIFASQEPLHRRVFNSSVNPGCNFNGNDCQSWSNISLIHVESKGENDTLHFIWSFIGSPSLLMVRTELETQLRINWNGFFSGDELSLYFIGPPPLYEFGWCLGKVWVYDDPDDLVDIRKVNQSAVFDLDTKNFLWERSDIQSNTTHVKFVLLSKLYYDELDGTTESLGEDGFFKIIVRMRSHQDYSEYIPYMLYTENNTQVDIAFNKVHLNTTNKPFPSNARIGFNFLFIQNSSSLSELPTSTMRVDKIKTLDDEHSPGVFEMYNLRTPNVHGDEAYVQWKPICYTAEERDVEDSIDAWSYPLRQLHPGVFQEHLKSSLLLWSYFGDKRIKNQLVESLNITYGTQQDGFYQKTNHVSWTLSVGFGEPPADYVSTLVMLVIVVGLGIPVLIILGSAFYVLLKKLKAPRHELLLSGQ